MVFECQRSLHSIGSAFNDFKRFTLIRGGVDSTLHFHEVLGALITDDSILFSIRRVRRPDPSYVEAISLCE